MAWGIPLLVFTSVNRLNSMRCSHDSVGFSTHGFSSGYSCIDCYPPVFGRVLWRIGGNGTWSKAPRRRFAHPYARLYGRRSCYAAQLVHFLHLWHRGSFPYGSAGDQRNRISWSGHHYSRLNCLDNLIFQLSDRHQCLCFCVQSCRTDAYNPPECDSGRRKRHYYFYNYLRLYGPVPNMRFASSKFKSIGFPFIVCLALRYKRYSLFRPTMLRSL